MHCYKNKKKGDSGGSELYLVCPDRLKAFLGSFKCTGLASAAFKTSAT